MRFFICVILLAAASITTPFAAEVDPSSACFKELEASEDLKILKPLVPLDDNEPTLEMLSNKKKPNEKEKIAIAKLDSGIASCNLKAKEWRSKNLPPNVVSRLDEHFAKMKVQLLNLYQGKDTYGEFLTKYSELKTQTKSAITAEVNALKAQKASNDAQIRFNQEQKKRQECEFRFAQIQQLKAQGEPCEREYQQCMQLVLAGRKRDYECSGAMGACRMATGFAQMQGVKSELQIKTEEFNSICTN